MAKRIQVGGRIESKEVGGIVTGAAEILDDAKGKKQSVINGETDDELARLDQSKQDNLTFDNAPTEGSDNPVKSGGVYAAEKALSDAIEAIMLLIPSAASALNKLVDTAMMNSSIATATATFKGTYNVVTDLSLTVDATHEQIAAALGNVISTADNNDYAFVQVPVSTESTDIRRTERYKFNGTVWGYEYDLNTSGFTAAQWAAINSGITLALVGKLIGLPTSSELQALLGQKQNTLTFDNVPTAGSANPVKSDGVHTAINDEKTAREQLAQTVTGIDGRVENVEEVIPTGAAANNKLVANNSMEAYVTSIIEAITASFTIATDDGHINLTLTQTNGRVASLTMTSSDIASAQALTALTGRVTTAEGNITTINGNITSLGGRVSTNETDIANLQQLYNNLQQSKPVPVTELPETGQQQGVIYRLAGSSSYSDYMWNGSTWVLMATYNNAIDPRPKKASQNLVTSGGVFDNMGALDVSELNATENPHTLAQYVDLSAALAAIPTDYQKGGMSIKYVHTSDNKYVQYRYMGTEVTGTPNPFLNISNWQKISDSIIELFLIGTTWNIVPTGWKTGYKLYDTDDKVIKTAGYITSSGGVGNWLSVETPRTNVLYKCGGKIYLWDGNDMIYFSDQTERALTISDAIGGKFVGEKLIELSREQGFLLENGTVDPSNYYWLTLKFDVSNLDIVYASGRVRSSNCLAATFDENNKLIQVFVKGGDTSISLYDVIIPVKNAKYIKVSGWIGAFVPYCRNVIHGLFADKLSQNELYDIIPTFKIDKNIDIEQGSLNDKEAFPSSQRIRSVDFIAVTGTLVLNSESGYGYRIYEYSSNSFSNFIQHNFYDNGGLNTFTPQVNTTYIRFVFLKTNGDNIIVSEFNKIGFTINGVKQYNEDWDIASKQYVDSAFAEKILQGKTVVFLGDSITAGGQGSGDEQVTVQKVYHKIFANLTGCINISLGAAGTCIANNTLNDLGPSRFVTRATQQNLSGADYIVVWGGTNDFSYDCKPIGDLFVEETITPDTYVGSKRKIAVTDTDTFAGALHDLITTIRSHNATAPVVFLTPLNRIRYNTGRPASNETNQWGNWMDDFRDAIKKICAFYSIPVFDIGLCGELDAQNSTIRSTYFADGIHPNASGHKIIGTLLYHWFKANMVY